MTTIQKQDQDFVQQLIRQMLIAYDMLDIANSAMLSCVGHVTEYAGAKVADAQYKTSMLYHKQRDFLQPLLEQREQFELEGRHDTADYLLPLEWPKIPEDGVYAKGWIHQGMGGEPDNYDIHDQSSFEHTRPCPDCKPIVMLDHDRYVQMTEQLAAQEQELVKLRQLRARLTAFAETMLAETDSLSKELKIRTPEQIRQDVMQGKY